MNEWSGPEGSIGTLVSSESTACLGAYREKPNLVEQDAGIEISNVEGGYGRKQIHELIQNSADAMRGVAGTQQRIGRGVDRQRAGQHRRVR